MFFPSKTLVGPNKLKALSVLGLIQWIRPLSIIIYVNCKVRFQCLLQKSQRQKEGLDKLQMLSLGGQWQMTRPVNGWLWIRRYFVYYFACNISGLMCALLIVLGCSIPSFVDWLPRVFGILRTLMNTSMYVFCNSETVSLLDGGKAVYGQISPRTTLVRSTISLLSSKRHVSKIFCCWYSHFYFLGEYISQWERIYGYWNWWWWLCAFHDCGCWIRSSATYPWGKSLTQTFNKWSDELKIKMQKTALSRIVVC